MRKEKIEIKLEAKDQYYFNLIKQYITTILKFIFSLFILAGTIYIGFYLLLFIFMIAMISYILKKIKI